MGGGGVGTVAVGDGVGLGVDRALEQVALVLRPVVAGVRAAPPEDSRT